MNKKSKTIESNKPDTITTIALKLGPNKEIPLISYDPLNKKFYLGGPRPREKVRAKA